MDLSRFSIYLYIDLLRETKEKLFFLCTTFNLGNKVKISKGEILKLTRRYKSIRRIRFKDTTLYGIQGRMTAKILEVSTNL